MEEKDKEFFEVEELDDGQLDDVAGGSENSSGCINGSCSGSTNGSGCENSTCFEEEA